MQENIHKLASDFLNDYLRQHGGSTHLSVVSARPRHVVENRAAAAEFIKQLRKSRREQREAARYEIEHEQSVILARSGTRCAQFFCGWKYNGFPVFSYDRRLAIVVESDDATRHVEALAARGIDVNPLPAPIEAKESF
jgi:hypothetical protein